MPGRWWWHADGNRCSSAEKEWSRQENTQWNLTRGGYCNKGVRFHWIAGLVVCTAAAGRANEWSSTRNMWCVCVHPYIDEKYFSVTKWLSGELRQYLLHKNPQTDPSTCNQLTYVRYSLHFLTLPYIPQFINKFQQHNHLLIMCSELHQALTFPMLVDPACFARQSMWEEHSEEDLEGFKSGEWWCQLQTRLQLLWWILAWYVLAF